MKPFYKSKAKWAALLLIVAAVAKVGAAYLATGVFDYSAHYAELTTALTGLGIWGVRDALK